PARNTKTGGAWPYFAIPVAGKDWRKRAEAIARSLAEDLRREAALAPARWAELPCIVGSSSFSVGAWDEGGWAALEPSFDFSCRLARGFGVHGPVTAVSTTCTSGLSALDTGMDAQSVTGPAADGAVIANVMRAAMAGARWESAAVDLIKLQSGGGPLADSAEANAVREVFAPVPRTVSLKGALGHTLGASGPAELALLLASLSRGRVPATWGFAIPDDELGLAPSGGDAEG